MIYVSYKLKIYNYFYKIFIWVRLLKYPEKKIYSYLFFIFPPPPPLFKPGGLYFSNELCFNITTQKIEKTHNKGKFQ